MLDMLVGRCTQLHCCAISCAYTVMIAAKKRKPTLKIRWVVGVQECGGGCMCVCVSFHSLEQLS